MRKVKKINGYLVVRFNEREKEENPGLGSFGVIDAEVYTGDLDFDRSEMEYDDADSIEVAVEQARGLDAERDIDDAATRYTVVIDGDDTLTEEEVFPQMLIEGWETQLKTQVKSKFHPEMDAEAAAHELHGFKKALDALGMLPDRDIEVDLGRFAREEAEAAEALRMERQTFEHLPNRPGAVKPEGARKVYALGMLLEADCPENDCRVFLNVFRMARAADEALDVLDGHAAWVMEQELRHDLSTLWSMYLENYAIHKYRESLKT